VQSSTQQAVLSRAAMDDLPTGHSVFSDAQTLPGATLSRPDVGGSSGMQQTTIQIHGANTSDCMFQMDGMNVSQFGSCAVGVYYNGSEQEFDEVVISRRFGEDDEFGSCGSHLLSLQQQVTQVSVTAPASH
jgi:hypothetical protein